MLTKKFVMNHLLFVERPIASSHPFKDKSPLGCSRDRTDNLNRSALSMIQRAAVRQNIIKSQLRGQTRPMHVRLLLTQHPFAVAAHRSLPRSEGHRTGRSPASTRPERRLHIRRKPVRSTRCGTERTIGLLEPRSAIVLNRRRKLTLACSAR